MRKVLVALLVIAALATGLLYWLLSDPNRFKSEITERIQAETGLVVDLRGALSWRLWPPVQLVARDVVADWTPAPAQPLLSVTTLELDVDVLPLLGSDARLVVNGVRLAGLDAHLVQRGETTNWTRPGSEEPAPTPVPVAVPPAEDAAAGWEISTIELRDSQLHYDLDGEIYDVAIDELVLADLAPGRSSPTRGTLTVTTATGSYEVEARAEVETAADAARIDVRRAVVSGTAQPRNLPFAATFDAGYDVANSIVTVTGAKVELAGVKATVDVEGTELDDVPRWSGRIALPRQSLAGLAGLSEADLREPVALEARYAATSERVDLEDLELHYGDTIVKGKAGARLGEHVALTFDLVVNAFTIPTDDAPPVALGAGGFGTIAFAAPAIATDPSLDEPILPLEEIRALDWDGSLLVQKLLYDQVTFPDARISTKNRDGRIDGTVRLPQFFGGTADAAWTVDARSDAPRWTVRPKLANVNSEALLAWLGQKYTWAALLLGNADLTMTGNTARELATSLRGTTEFDGGQGKLDIAAIKQQALAIAAIAGGTEKVDAWPDVLDYKRFTGTWKVDGTRQDLEVLLDNLSLALDGTVDPFADALDVVASVKLLEGTPYQSFQLDPILMNIDVPVRCTGTLDAPDCKPDQAGVRKLLTRVITSDNPEVKAKIDKTIDEKVPEQYRDAARSLLDMLRQGGGQTPQRTEPQPAPAP